MTVLDYHFEIGFNDVTLEENSEFQTIRGGPTMACPGPVIESLPMRSNMIDTNRFSLKRLVTYFARKWSFVSMSSYMSSHMIEIE